MKIKIENLSIETGENVDGVTFSVNSFGAMNGYLESTIDSTEKDCETKAKAYNLMTNLDSMSWDEIDMIGKSGKVKEKFALGATKRFVTDNDEEIVMQIIDFYHDYDQNGNLIPISWDMVGIMDEEYVMNENCTNKGGWKSSDMNKYLNGEVFDSLPEDLRKVIKPCVKETSKGSGSSEIETSTDKLWLRSVQEVFGRNFYTAEGEGKWYELYRQENIPWGKKYQNGAGDSNWSWLRSPYTGYSTGFYFVGSTGSGSGGNNAYYSSGVCFGFCI